MIRNPTVESLPRASFELNPMMIPENKQKSREADVVTTAAEGTANVLLKHSSSPEGTVTPRLCSSVRYLGLNELCNICFIRRAQVCF